jgi:hypothetical protein
VRRWRGLRHDGPLRELAWERREIENYLAIPEALLAYARSTQELSLFASGAEQVMGTCLRSLVLPLALDNPADPWWRTTKMSDDFLDRLFDLFVSKLGLPNLMRKNEYHQLARRVPPERIDPDVIHKLDEICQVAESAHPVGQGSGESPWP